MTTFSEPKNLQSPHATTEDFPQSFAALLPEEFAELGIAMDKFMEDLLNLAEIAATELVTKTFELKAAEKKLAAMKDTEMKAPSKKSAKQENGEKETEEKDASAPSDGSPYVLLLSLDGTARICSLDDCLADCDWLDDAEELPLEDLPGIYMAFDTGKAIHKGDDHFVAGPILFFQADENGCPCEIGLRQFCAINDLAEEMYTTLTDDKGNPAPAFHI